VSLIPRWRSVTKRTLDLFGRWGDPRTQLKSMWDGVIPVVVVDRFRDDDEGSVFGINAFCSGNPNEFPSVSFGSAVNDWEILQIPQVSIDYAGLGGSKVFGMHMFTPIDPYNPALNIAPAGFFRSGMINNRAFTFGTVSALGGTNPVLPAVFGPDLVSPGVTSFSSFSRFLGQGGQQLYLPPIRIYRDTTFTIQWNGTIGGTFMQLFVSMLYRERPKVSSS